MAAEFEPELPGIGPERLAMIARQTVATGNFVGEIGVGRAGVRILPVASYSITGDSRPESWRYAIKQQRPNGDDPLDLDQIPARSVPETGIVHVDTCRGRVVRGPGSRRFQARV